MNVSLIHDKMYVFLSSLCNENEIKRTLKKNKFCRINKQNVLGSQDYFFWCLILIIENR